MTIVVLGWGSLCWDPRKLRIADGWHDDGPHLPVEFARMSSDGRLTLVLFERAEQQNVQVLWAKMNTTTLNEAIDSLRERECCGKKYMGCVDLDDSQNNNCNAVPKVLGIIKEWTTNHNFSATIWTDLLANFENTNGRKFDKESVIKYLRDDLDRDCRKRAEEYVRKTPCQVKTKMRTIIEEELHWFGGAYTPPYMTSESI